MSTPTHPADANRLTSGVARGDGQACVTTTQNAAIARSPSRAGTRASDEPFRFVI